LRLIIASHSYAHPRQQLFAKELVKYCDLLCIAPTVWTVGLSKRQVEVIDGAPVELLNTTIPQDWFHSSWVGLEKVVQKFRPDVFWMVEEPWTCFALQGLNLAKRYGFKYGIFSWENIAKDFGNFFGGIERIVLDECDFIVAGNEECEEVLLSKGGEKAKITIMPMVGVDTSIFMPMGIEKRYDTIYVGNHLTWKGLPYIESVVRELGLKHLWVGEGNYQPIYGDRAGYGLYLDLPKYYNSARLAIHFSLKTPHWKEQFNYVSLESLACGLPIIVERTRVMEEIFSGCEAVNFVEEGDVKGLREKTKELLAKDESELKDLGRIGRNFVKTRYDNEVIAERLLEVVRA